jgi:uncharacterized membrane protein YfcA
MAGRMRSVGNSNETGGTYLQLYPPINTGSAVGSEYDAATVSSIVFGIFMALLALYTIWQYSRQYNGNFHMSIKSSQG